MIYECRRGERHEADDSGQEEPTDDEGGEAALAYEENRTCPNCGLLVAADGATIPEARPITGSRRIGKVIELRGKSRGVPR